LFDISLKWRIGKRSLGKMGETVDNLERMDEAQLRDLIQRAQEMMRERGTKRLEELRQLAKEAGYEVTLTKIGETERRRGRPRSAARDEERGTKRRGKVKPKYRNPENPGETWSGRGRKPKWVEMALAHDRTLEDLAIRAQQGAEA
jgi:DNA-binding protein H-NS